MRENRIKVYDSVSGAFSKEYKSPCIVFTGHPSLRIGNVVNFLELWGQDKKSVIISTGNLAILFLSLWERNSFICNNFTVVILSMHTLNSRFFVLV